MGTITAIPRDQSDKFRRSIERQIFELESRIVPGMLGRTVQVLREQVLALENKLKPIDDKRNPKYYRPKRVPREVAPVLHWNRSDWVAAKWGAKKRAGGLCEICGAVPPEIARIHTAPPAGADITREHVECVCSDCDQAQPRPQIFPINCHDTLS